MQAYLTFGPLTRYVCVGVGRAGGAAQGAKPVPGVEGSEEPQQPDQVECKGVSIYIC